MSSRRDLPTCRFDFDKQEDSYHASRRIPINRDGMIEWKMSIICSLELFHEYYADLRTMNFGEFLMDLALTPHSVFIAILIITVGATLQGSVGLGLGFIGCPCPDNLYVLP